MIDHSTFSEGCAKRLMASQESLDYLARAGHSIVAPTRDPATPESTGRRAISRSRRSPLSTTAGNRRQNAMLSAGTGSGSWQKSLDSTGLAAARSVPGCDVYRGEQRLAARKGACSAPIRNRLLVYGNACQIGQAKSSSPLVWLDEEG